MGSNNLNELNAILFDTLRGVEKGSIDEKKANSVIGLSNAIINGAKVQLNALKAAGRKNIAPEFFSIEAKASGPKTVDLGEMDKHKQMLMFSLEKGYDNVAAAMASLGKDNFNKEFESWTK